MPCFYCFMWPLSVAGEDSGRYFFTAFTVSPGHVTNWLLCTDFRRFALGGLNAVWCRYWTRLDFDVIAYVLCAYFYAFRSFSCNCRRECLFPFGRWCLWVVIFTIFFAVIFLLATLFSCCNIRGIHRRRMWLYILCCTIFWWILAMPCYLYVCYRYAW